MKYYNENIKNVYSRLTMGNIVKGLYCAFSTDHKNEVHFFLKGSKIKKIYSEKEISTSIKIIYSHFKSILIEDYFFINKHYSDEEKELLKNLFSDVEIKKARELYKDLKLHFSKKI